MSDAPARPNLLTRFVLFLLKAFVVIVVVFVLLVWWGSTLEDTTDTAEAPASGVSAAPEEQPEDAFARTLERYDGLTLDGYRDLRAGRREELVAAFMDQAGAPEEALSTFMTCMGDYAGTKSPELLALDVFGWCENERLNIPERFTGHFNELDARDVSVEALIRCRRLVEANLRAPATADFPTFDYTTIYKGRHRYAIRSYVDSQNGFGAMIRTWWFCDLQLVTPESDPYDPRSWKLFDLSFE